MALMFFTLVAWLGVACAAVTVAWMLPVRLMVFLWGVLLAVNATAYTPAIALTGAKIFGAVVIILRCKAETEAKRVYSWVLPLCALGGMMVVDGMTSANGSRAIGTYIALYAVLGLAICRRPSISGPVLIGYAVGCTASAVVLIMQVMEMPTFAADPTGQIGGGGRYAGLSQSAPMVAMELAVGCSILFVTARAQSGSRPWLRVGAVLGALTCLFALFACGGRGGLAALSLGAIIATYQGILRFKHVVLGVAGVWLAFYLAAKYAVSFSTLDRIDGLDFGSAGSEQITTGRDVLFQRALDDFMQAPLIGPGYGQFLSRYGIMPHFAPLTFAVSAGILGAAVGVYLMFRLASLALKRKQVGHGTWSALAPSIGAVFFVMSSIEPEGPFMSLGMMSVLFICVSSLDTTPGTDLLEVADHQRAARRPATSSA